MLIIAVADASVVVVAIVVSLGEGFKEDVTMSAKMNEATKLLESRFLNIAAQFGPKAVKDPIKKDV